MDKKGEEYRLSKHKSNIIFVNGKCSQINTYMLQRQVKGPLHRLLSLFVILLFCLLRGLLLAPRPLTNCLDIVEIETPHSQVTEGPKGLGKESL